MRKQIRNGHVIDPANGINQVADVYIDRGVIVAVGRRPSGFTADKTIDATGKLVCPGLVDLSVHLSEPGEEFKATIASETTAAAASGITSLCCPPDTNPVIDSTAVVELINQRAQKIRKARVYPIGAMTSELAGKVLAEMGELQEAGCIGVGNAWRPLNNSVVLLRALDYAATVGMTVHLSCEDGYLRDGGVMHEGIMSTRLGLPGIPETAETVAVMRALLLIEQTGARVHFCRLSSARSIELIAEAKKQGLPVSADVAITHLFLTEMDLADFNSNCYLEPPLRNQSDRDGLRRGIANGTIDAVCSNHRPQDNDAKTAPFSLSQPGASALDVLLPLGLQLAGDKLLSVSDIIAALTVNPARVAGINAGTLTKDIPADICIIDPDMNWTITPDTIQSTGKNSPFLGWELKGRVVQTLLGGRNVYRHKAGWIHMNHPETRGTIFSEQARVIEQQARDGNQFILRLESPLTASHARPGSFVHMQCDIELKMRRPMSIMRADPTGGWIDILYKIHGEGTQRLSRKKAGDIVDILGPIGVPFKLEGYSRYPLLIGGGVGMPPMVFLAEYMQKTAPDCRPFVILGSEIPFPFSARPSRIMLDGLPDGAIASMPLLEDWGIPSRLASWQGYAGCFEGFVTDLARHWLDALDEDQRREVEVFTCGPMVMLDAVSQLAHEYSLACQVSVEEYMACAVGGCAGCTIRVETETGPAMKRVCVDGPVFDAASVFPPAP